VSSKVAQYLCNVDRLSELHHQASSEAVATEVSQTNGHDGHLHVVLLLSAQRDRRHASLYFYEEKSK